MSVAEIEQELEQLRHRIDALDSTGQPTGWLTARIAALNQALERRAHAGQTNTPHSVAKGLFAQMRQHVADRTRHESRGDAVAKALLEADDDVKDDLMASSLDGLISVFPEDFQGIAEHLPDEFLVAYGRPDGEAEIPSEFDSEEGWPTENDDTDDQQMRWCDVRYAPTYRIGSGRLYVGVDANDEGDVSTVNEVPWGTPAHRRLRIEFGLKAWYESLAAYYTSVVETGIDPLHYIFPLSFEKHATKWKVGIREVNGRPKFWKARKILSKPPSPPAIDNPAELPKEARDYLNLDENGFLLDFTTMAEFTALPDVKAMRGYWQVEFDTEEKKRNEAANRQHVIRVATRSVREYTDKAAATSPEESLVVP